MVTVSPGPTLPVMVILPLYVQSGLSGVILRSSTGHARAQLADINKINSTLIDAMDARPSFLKPELRLPEALKYSLFNKQPPTLN
jgi:hypothetical protein